jgi:hypothetical protein
MDGCEIKMGRESSVRCRAMLADCQAGLAKSAEEHSVLLDVFAGEESQRLKPGTFRTSLRPG